MNNGLEGMRKRIPSAHCPAGCIACCGEGVRVSHSEIKRIGPPDTLCLVGCVWLGADRRCRVYEERPIFCRLFGIAANPESDFYCEYCDGEKLGDAEIMAIITEYETMTMNELHAYTALGQELSRGLNGDIDNGRSAKRAGPWTDDR